VRECKCFLFTWNATLSTHIAETLADTHFPAFSITPLLGKTFPKQRREVPKGLQHYVVSHLQIPDTYCYLIPLYNNDVSLSNSVLPSSLHKALLWSQNNSRAFSVQHAPPINVQHRCSCLDKHFSTTSVAGWSRCALTSYGAVWETFFPTEV
jgi:hypothetical protein